MIRTREDALKVLQELNRLDPRSQIVFITARLAECLTPETRQMLYRMQEGFVTGKLTVRIKERETMRRGKPQQEGAEEEAPIDDSRMSVEIATALEALKMAAVVFDVFPQMARAFARWEVARIALNFPDDVRRIVTEGADPANAAGSERKLTSNVQRFRPWWHAQVPTIAEACAQVIAQVPRSRWAIGAQSLLDIVATSELRAMYAAKESIPNQRAMLEPLGKIYKALQRIVVQVYPDGLPEGSALAI